MVEVVFSPVPACVRTCSSPGLAYWFPVGPSDRLPRRAIGGEGSSLLTAKLRTLGGLACEDGVRGSVFYYYLLFLLF